MPKKKRKVVKIGGTHATQSFAQLTNNTNREALKPYVNQVVQQYFGMQQQQLNQTLNELYLRQLMVEKVIMEKLEISEAELNDRMASLQDQTNGLVRVEKDAIVEEGDRVRFSISTKAKDQDEFADTTKNMIDNAGREPYSFGETVDKAFLGMKLEESKTIEIGKDMIAKVVVQMISRKEKKDEKNNNDESKNSGSKD